MLIGKFTLKYTQKFSFTNGYKQLQPKVNGMQPTNYQSASHLCPVEMKQRPCCSSDTNF